MIWNYQPYISRNGNQRRGRPVVGARIVSSQKAGKFRLVLFASNEEE
jgi:hypothetical protein